MNQFRGKRNLGLSFKRKKGRGSNEKPVVHGLAEANVPSLIAQLVISTLQFVLSFNCTKSLGSTIYCLN